ncbi:MAG: GntR family transcriptional regulator [Verrucomicrobiota bacterium]
MQSVKPDQGQSEQIASQLRNDIISGRMKEGAPLREIALAKQFKVGRGPIREALQRLSHEGMVTAKPNCGVRVAASPPDSIQELIIPLRRTLETFALRSFYHDLKPTDFQRWDDILQRMRRACEDCDYASTVELDIEFHQSIVERAEQNDLLSIWLTMVSRLRHQFQQGHRKYDDAMKIYYEHAAIVAIFQTGDLEQSLQTLEWSIS